MRILQVITDTDRRGAQVFAVDLGAALGELGHQVTTVALTSGANPVRLAVHELGPRRLGVSTLRRLRDLVLVSDVVAAHGSSTLPACSAATLGTGVPFVYRQISESLFWAPDRWSRWRVRTYLSRARRVVTLASSQGRILHEHFGVPSGKLVVVPNGVPSAGFAPATERAQHEARLALGLEPEVPVVLYIGALVPEKGADLAVDAVGRDGRAQLLVVGDGPERASLEGRAGALGDRVHFAGSLAEPRVAYAAADVVVLPSRGGDSMPATLVEAGFCGLPAVATEVGAISDIVLDGRTGVIVAKDDAGALAAAVGGLVADRGRARALGEAARAHCLDRFEISVVARAWEQALRGA